MSRPIERDPRVNEPIDARLLRRSFAAQIDWRGWVGLAWAIFWGIAYAGTVIEARAPHTLRWVGRLLR